MNKKKRIKSKGLHVFLFLFFIFEYCMRGKSHFRCIIAWTSHYLIPPQTQTETCDVHVF